MPSGAALLAWYDRHRRTLPWRGNDGDPYRIWLSEVMLQQTTAAAAGPRFRRFLQRFPDVQALAAAPETAVMEEWAGLGYYARARNLHACARAVAGPIRNFPYGPEAVMASRIQGAARLQKSRAQDREHSDKHAFYQ